MPSNHLVTDPVCGMRIDPARAAGSREHRGVTHYFCSPFCIRKFGEDADAYIAAARIREAEGRGGAAFGWDEHYDMS